MPSTVMAGNPFINKLPLDGIDAKKHLVLLTIVSSISVLLTIVSSIGADDVLHGDRELQTLLLYTLGTSL